MQLAALMDPELTRELPLSLENTGNGPLSWSVERRLLGDANADPWEFRRSYAVGDSMDDDNIYGVAFVDSIFWVSGRNDNIPTIYRIDMDGALIDTLPQPTDDASGMRDLTWDGDNFWATVGPQLIAFNRQGEIQRQFRGEYNPLYNITWDPDREWLWVSGTTTSTINAYDRDSTLQRRIPRQNLRMYGLAYWTEDPDRMPLYIFHRDAANNRQAIAKVNIETGEIRHVTYLDRPDTTPLGIFITNKFDVYSWVLMSIANASRPAGGDRIDIWQLDARKDWFLLDQVLGEERFEAVNGVINPGEGADYILTLRSLGLPTVLFQGELRFQHNATGAETNILVQMDVIGPRPPLPFSLSQPANGDTLDSTIVDFSWEPTFDPNAREVVTYNFWLFSGDDSAMVEVGAEPNLTVNFDTLGLEYGWNSRFNWRVEASSGEDVVPSNETFEFLYLPNDLKENPNPVPVEFGFRSIHPNPFNAAATIEFGLDRYEPVKLTVYDLLGREAAVILDATPAAGIHRLVWRPSELASGIYVMRLTAGNRVKMAKAVVLK
ncbi:MAG: T9SS type A sorting domain-containing protein [Calditrichota bacterium]